MRTGAVVLLDVARDESAELAGVSYSPTLTHSPLRLRNHLSTITLSAQRALPSMPWSTWLGVGSPS